MSIESVLRDAVSRNEDGETWDFQCPGIEGSLCGSPITGEFFSSLQWPTKKLATERGREHLAEHAAHPVIARLREEVVMAEQNVKGYEAVNPRTKQKELEEALAKHRTSSLEEFRAKHGLVVNSEGMAVKIEDLS